MLTEPSLKQMVERLVAVASPRKIILFGSQARGEADTGSDLDVMVIEARVDDPGQEMIRLRQAIGDMGTGVDVLVYSEQEATRRGQVPGTVIHQALREGRVLYDAPA
ncbi:nucleotidyltransferase domain-containing protein [Methylomagnum sp.]